ncbi:restriction endonuclease subunit S [Serratia ureilytica]|uniref:restriction endonuclease subunit S n=1 Tax=Serratia TaxID=613 RepID=UPI001C127005|nr:restriction endonuclease subunit S [Serratia ureilytica]MBU5414362.1 restriction endonuclease subunit S [Serratia ureilytica]
MSSVSFMEKLLDGVEVEWKTLGELGELVRGNGLQKKDFTENGVPAIHYGQIYTYYGLSTTETKSFVSPELAKKLRKVNKGDVVITNTSENLEDVGKALFYLGEQQAVTGGHATVFKPSRIILGKYFTYFTQTIEFANEKRKYAKGSKVIDVSATDMAKIKIPIPCPKELKRSLEIQAKIVRVLDTFTELTIELTIELNIRKKQYNYYRDLLLNFKEDEAEWKALGEIAEINTGQKLPEVLERVTVFDYINAGTARSGYAASSNCEGDTVTTPSRGQGGIGFVGYQKRPFWLGPLCYKIRAVDKEVLINKYLFYFLQSKKELLLGLKKEGGVPAVNKSDLSKLEIPLPTINKQKQIVAVLDEFDSLANSTVDGLPREIELRQKQYAYYRDLLFSFPKSNSEVAN